MKVLCRAQKSPVANAAWLELRLMMMEQRDLAPDEVAAVLGDVHPLVDQLGSTEGLVALNTVSAALQLDRIDSAAALSRFLLHYRNQVLVPVELPAITRAFCHASRNQTRELVALDRELGRQPVLRELAAASRRVGGSQLRRLRPLRDQRLVQRYLAAVEAGQANGWHTLVYGLTLALFSLPLRQGLSVYACQTLRGFIHSASRPLGLTEAFGLALLEEHCTPLPKVVNEIVEHHFG